MSRWVVIGTVLLLGAVGTLISLPGTSEANPTRTLHVSELYSVFGGATIDDHCCDNEGSCDGSGISCADAGAQEECEGTYQDDEFAVNKLVCSLPQTGATCIEDDQSVVCRKRTQCVWNADESQCVLSATRFIEVHVPKSCSDDCQM